MNAFATLNIEITQGAQGAIPIAVVPFAGQTDQQAPNNVSSVITADLQNSGRFKLMSSGQMRQMPASAAAVDFNYWQKQNINDLVVGSIKSLGGDQYQVSFQLINPYSAKAQAKNAAPVWQNSVLLSKSFTVNNSELRGLAHHISDLIYQNLTGVRGIFSTRIAYVIVQRGARANQYTLEASDYDGYNPRTLLRSGQPIMSPAWSPDGRRLAYVSFEDGSSAIYIQDVATGSRQRLPNFPGVNGAPAWSPYNSRLAFVLSKTGYPKIYMMNLATRSVTQLTQGESIDTEPSWAPDGHSIIFTSSRGGGPQIYQLTIPGGSIQRLTYHGNYNATASFTPDGTSIVMLNGAQNNYNVAIQNLQTGQFRLLTNSGWNQSPSIAPNGQMVVYATKVNGRGVLGMVSTDGRVRLMLPARDGNVREPAWSPFLNK